MSTTAGHACPRCGWAGGIKPRAAAPILGVSHQTVRSMIKLGELPGVVTEKRAGGSGWHYWIPVEVVRRAAGDGVTVEPDPASLRNCPRCGHRGALTPLEAAKELGVAEQTVRNRILDGRLPAETFPTSGGHRYLIRVEDLAAFKEAEGAVA